METLKLIQEVPGGRENIEALGLAIAVTWDQGKEFRVWNEQDAKALVKELRQWERVVGFNLIRFDYRVLQGYESGVINLLRPHTFDLLDDLTQKLGHRLSLESLAKATLGKSKTGNGEIAVQHFREGKITKVIEYCKGDVMLTRDIYLYGRQNGFVAYSDFNAPSGVRKVNVNW